MDSLCRVSNSLKLLSHLTVSRCCNRLWFMPPPHGFPLLSLSFYAVMQAVLPNMPLLPAAVDCLSWAVLEGELSAGGEVSSGNSGALASLSLESSHCSSMGELRASTSFSLSSREGPSTLSAFGSKIASHLFLTPPHTPHWSTGISSRLRLVEAKVCDYQLTGKRQEVKTCAGFTRSHCTIKSFSWM